MIAEQQSMKFETKEGKLVTARPLTTYDAPYLVQIFENMSPESRYRRFQQSLDNPSPKQIWEEAEKIAQMDEDEQGGLIVFKPRPLLSDVPVAAARYVLLNDSTAEIAMSVVDEMHGQGLGSWLLQITAAQAQQRGIQTLVGSALNDNDAIWHLFNKLPYPYTKTFDGTSAEIEIDLTIP